MDHQSGTDAVELAALEHEDLATTGFLGRSADHAHGDAEFVRERGQPDPGPDSRGGDDVVPTCVPDSGKRVVFRAERENQLATAVSGVECGREIGDAGADLEPGVAEDLDDLGGAAVFAERQFRLCVDRMRQCDQGV